MRDVVELLDTVDLAVLRAEGVVDEDRLAEFAERAEGLRTRRGFFGGSLVIAIAGGTGSGKSSLLNAIAGEDVASVSLIRPHTDAPLAWIPKRPEPGLRLLIDELGIDRRVEQDEIPEVALIDLPDVDSVAAWHRRTVEELLPNVDGVLWVFDPEKYHDAVLHEQFLGRLSGYGDQFLFVLNQIDRLSPDGATGVSAHLRSVLVDDGFADPTLFLTAAAPPDGQPEGIEALRKHLQGRLDTKRIAIGKLVADAQTLLRDLADSAGVWEGASVDFGSRWRAVREISATELGGGVARREDALCRIEDLLAAIAAESGPGTGRRVRRQFDTAAVESAIDAAAGVAPPLESPGRRWPWKPSESPDPNVNADVEKVLDDRIGSPVAEILWGRALLSASVAFAAIGAEQLAMRYRLGD